MNYLKQHLAFIDRLRYVKVSSNAAVLYHYIFDYVNKAGWPRELKLPSHLLMGDVGISASEFRRCREELAEAGYIKYSINGGKAGSTYTLIKLYRDTAITVETRVEYEQPQEHSSLPPVSPPELPPVSPPVYGSRNYIKQKGVKATPPTQAQIEAYIAEKKLDVNSSRFYRVYAANDWLDRNGLPMAGCWKMKLEEWHADDNSLPRGSPAQQAGSPTQAFSRNYTNSEWGDLIDIIGEE